MKILLIILDGLADSKGKTSLEKARTPNLDFLASKSNCGLLWPIKGIAPESGAAQFVLLGYPLALYPGRGPIEALGAGYRIRKGEVALRVNFAKIKGKKIIDTRAKIPSKDIIKRLNKIDKDIKIMPTVDYRGVMIIKGSPDISNTHPGYVRYKNYSRAVTRDKTKRNCRGHNETCRKINNFIEKAERILKNKTLLLRGAGNKIPEVRKMKNWYFVGDMPVEHGLAKMTRMKIVKIKKDEIKQIINLSRKSNVYVQIKGPDIPGHEGDFKGKVKEIEKVDRMLKPLTKIKTNKLNTVICITSDHATPCKLKRHSSDPVPCLIYGKKGKGKKDKVKRFSEKECANGFRSEGKQLMKMLKDC